MSFVKFISTRKTQQSQHSLNLAVSHRHKMMAVLLSSTVLFSGCALMPEKQEESPKSDLPVVEKRDEQSAIKAVDKNLNLDSQTMFQIMAAEMMVQRKQPNAAFTVLYPVVQELRDKDLAKRLFQISMSTYQLNKIEQATLLWREVAPESAKAWRASFILSLRKGKMDEALAQWEQYQQLSELNLASDMIASASKVAATVPAEQGIPFFEKLTQKYPNEWSAFYGLGMVSSVHKNPQVGIPALERAKALMLEVDAGDSLSLIYNLLSKLYLYVSPPEKGIDALTAYADSNPKDLLVQERLARLEVQAKRYQDAEQRYKYIVQQEPEAYTSLFSLALLQLERKGYQDAEHNLLKVSEQKGYKSVAYYYLGILYQEQKEYAAAKKFFSGVTSASYVVDAKLHLAEIVYAEESQQKAMDILDSISTTKPKDKIKVLRAKAIFSTTNKEYVKAIEFYDQALQLDANNIEVLKAQSLLFYKVEDFVGYEANLLKVLKVDTQDSDALNALGYFYVEQNKNLDQAFILLNRALELEPNSYYILDSMGWYYYHVGQYDKALQYLNQAFEMSEDDEVFIHLISAYWQSGEVEKARSLWEEFRGKFSSSDEVQNIINELELNSKR